jgi:hypothetical protein
MKIHRSIGVVLFAVLVLGVTASASAETTLLAEWLLNGAPVTTLTSVEGSGEILWEDIGNKAGITCSDIGDGSVGPNGEGEITEILTLAGVAVSLVTPTLCKKLAGSACEESATDIEAAPEKLPWRGSLVLSEAGTFLTELLEGEAAYVVSCLVLGIKVTDECSTTKSKFEVLNVTGGVEAMGEGSPLANCSLGGAEKGRLEALPGNLLKALAGTLSISSE